MDLQKEREVLQQLINEMGDVTNTWSVDQMVTHVWKQAKAQAVPEGFVLVPKEPTDEIIEAMNEFDYRNDYSDMDGAYRTIVETLEKAQEDAERGPAK